MKKFENFCNAYKNLRDIYDYDEPYANVVLTGMVGLFEVCFEQSWKAMKEILERDGFREGQSGSPRQILKAAHQAGMLEDEDMWLSALVSRNNVSHAYNKEIALDIIRKTKSNYYRMFGALKEEIEKEWM